MAKFNMRTNIQLTNWLVLDPHIGSEGHCLDMVRHSVSLEKGATQQILEG